MKKLIGRVGHVERYNPSFIAARQFGLDKPVFIEAHRLAPFNPRGMDVPVVMDLMIHDIDLVLSMIDSEVDHIEANGVGVAENLQTYVMQNYISEQCCCESYGQPNKPEANEKAQTFSTG